MIKVTNYAVMQNLKQNKVTLAIFVAILGTVTHAADPQKIDADQKIRQQQRDQALEKQIQPIPNVQTGLDQSLQSKPQLQYLKSHSESVCFDFKKFVLMGEDARQFTFAMCSVTQGENNLIGRCIGVQGLNQALDLIQNSIISHGYVTTRMLLPPQNIASGVVNLQVIAGKVDQIQFTQGTSKRFDQCSHQTPECRRTIGL